MLGLKLIHVNERGPRIRLNIEIVSYQHWNSHYRYKTISQPCYLYDNGNTISGSMLFIRKWHAGNFALRTFRNNYQEFVNVSSDWLATPPVDKERRYEIIYQWYRFQYCIFLVMEPGMSQRWNVTGISHCVSQSKGKPLLNITIYTRTENDDIRWCIYALAVCRMCLWVKSFLKNSWWRHQMEKFSALLAICAGNSPVSGEFPAQRPVMRSFDVFFDLRLNKRLSKQSWGRWFEISQPLWRHRNVPAEVNEEWCIWSSMIHWCLFPLFVRKWDGVYYVSTTQIKNMSSVFQQYNRRADIFFLISKAKVARIIQPCRQMTRPEHMT